MALVDPPDSLIAWRLRQTSDNKLDTCWHEHAASGPERLKRASLTVANEPHRHPADKSWRRQLAEAAMVDEEIKYVQVWLAHAPPHAVSMHARARAHTHTHARTHDHARARTHTHTHTHTPGGQPRGEAAVSRDRSPKYTAGHPRRFCAGARIQT